METITSFGYWVRRQRKALDLTQKILAERVGCSVAAIKKIESDERRPSRQIAERMVDSLGVPASQREVFLDCARGLRPADELGLAFGPAESTPGPLPAQQKIRHNLPIQLTSFIGREHEMAEVRRLLSRARLLTLIGPGGTGKTRLALQIAQDLVEGFSNGVWLVELAALSDPSLLPLTLASVFELRDAPKTPVMDILTNYLRGKDLLLILDNCEHLIEACARLSADILRACPRVKVLATSREALGISGETVYRVPSLSLPDPSHTTREALMESEAARLFVERAAAVQPHFALQDGNVPAATQICHRLDGIPLALELAAARVAVFSPEEIALRLDDRFRLLTGGSRTALERHQTLRALIDWSHDLLSPEERILFRQLSVFSGGWTFEAAEAICAGLDVLNLLPQLVNKSLVMADEQAEETRYRLPETIRQYARDKLLEAGEGEQIRDRHLDFFIGFAERAERRLRSAEQLKWLNREQKEHDNLRAALGWSLESARSEKALELAGALSYFWELRGVREGYKWLDEALQVAKRQQSEPVSPARRARALYGAGRLRFMSLLDPHGSRELVEESLRLWRELGDKWWMAVALEHVGFIAGVEGDGETALARLEEGVSLAREVEDRWPLALCLVRLSGFLIVRGVEVAHQARAEGVAVARAVGDRSILSQGLLGLVTIYQMEGDPLAAERAGQEALTEARAIGDFIHVMLSLIQLVGSACLQGNPAKAEDYCYQALSLAREAGASQWLLLVILAFGFAAIYNEEPARGVQLIAAAVALAAQLGINFGGGDEPHILILRQSYERARSQLAPAAYAVAMEEGRALTLEQALALATGEGTEVLAARRD